MGSVTVADNRIILFGGVADDSERNNCIGFDPIKKTMAKQESILSADAFYRTKPGIRSDKIMIVGSHDADLHMYNKATGKWELMLRKIWNPEFGFQLKCDTF